MLYADYNFYTETYNGISIGGEEEFNRLCTRASSFLDYVTGGKSKECVDDALKMAACAVAEAWKTEEDGGEIISQSVGSWTRTYAPRPGRTKEQRLTDEARMYLEPIGLMQVTEWA